MSRALFGLDLLQLTFRDDPGPDDFWSPRDCPSLLPEAIRLDLDAARALRLLALRQSDGEDAVRSPQFRPWRRWGGPF
jgi:hypothetical protein